jgi:hypothetical protein
MTFFRALSVAVPTSTKQTPLAAALPWLSVRLQTRLQQPGEYPPNGDYTSI